MGSAKTPENVSSYPSLESGAEGARTSLNKISPTQDDPEKGLMRSLQLCELGFGLLHVVFPQSKSAQTGTELSVDSCFEMLFVVNECARFCTGNNYHQVQNG